MIAIISYFQNIVCSLFLEFKIYYSCTILLLNLFYRLNYDSDKIFVLD